MSTVALQVPSQAKAPTVPVTNVVGTVGADKTTLLSRTLCRRYGERIGAIILLSKSGVVNSLQRKCLP